MMWVCLKMLCTPLYPMVLLIIIPMKNGYFIGNINPTFSDEPTKNLLVSRFWTDGLSVHWVFWATHPRSGRRNSAMAKPIVWDCPGTPKFCGIRTSWQSALDQWCSKDWNQNDKISALSALFKSVTTVKSRVRMTMIILESTQLQVVWCCMYLAQKEYIDHPALIWLIAS